MTTRKTLRLSHGVLGWLAVCWTLAPGCGAQQVGGLVATAGAVASASEPPMNARAPLETKVFPLAEVKRGQQGVAYTVFEGVLPEPMRVEILGVLKDSLGPGQDMILARLHGTKPEYTGVVAGMSGSPVYIDGRLVGALSYRIGHFSKEPIAGITPIEQMLEVRDGGLRTPEGMRPAATGKTSEMQAMETPLVFSGFSQEAVERFGDRFREMGLTPVAGLGGADAKQVQPEPLVPGSAVSAVLVRGDMTMAGTCTVTYVDPKRLLACGHPITQYGPVQMPMTKADVVATLASPLNAFKIVNSTETVGAFTEDRASAIMGRFDQTARMIPVTVEVGPAPGTGAQVASRTFHFEVLDNRQLTPSAMLVSVYQTLQGTNAAGAEMSYSLRGELTLTDKLPAEGVKAGRAGVETVKLAGLLAQNEFNSGAINTALFVNDRFSRVYGNAVEQPEITGLHLKIEALPERRTATLETVRLSRMEAHAGETLDVEATLHPYQADAKVVRFAVKLPDSLTPGPMRVLVSDGATLDRLRTSTAAAQHAVGLADTVQQMNALHANDRVYVTLLDRTSQASLESGTLEALPLSMVNVLSAEKQSQRIQLAGESLVEAGSRDTGYAVTGAQVLSLLVR